MCVFKVIDDWGSYDLIDYVRDLVMLWGVKYWICEYVCFFE